METHNTLFINFVQKC